MCNPVNIRLVSWSDAPAQLHLRAVRVAVFIREQGVPEELEWDEEDLLATHLLATDSHGTPIGTARMVATFDHAHIGRVAVTKPWRGRGVGLLIMRRLLAEAARQGLETVHLNAQIDAIGFYERLGFVAEGEVFMDAGIPHRHMWTKAAIRPSE